jgi:NitT/TauT family transport system ATP-binding protein
MPLGICVVDVGFAYSTEVLLDHVSFTIPKGEVWALLGRSGCGKSTLLNIVAGIFKPLRGQVFIDDLPVNKPGRIRGIIFQEDTLLWWKTVLSNCTFVDQSSRAGPESPDAISLLSQVGLANVLTEYPKTLSVGMRKRVEFVRALLSDTHFMLADEPFATLDVWTRHELWRIWQSLRTSNPRTGLLTTHDPDEAARLCDGILILSPQRPTTILQSFRVPMSIRSLDVYETEPALENIKARIVACLDQISA